MASPSPAASGSRGSTARRAAALRFANGFARNGLIRVYPPPDKESSDWPITGLAIADDVLLVGDRRGNRVLKYHKVSGEKLGEFPVDHPGPMAVDPAGRLWIARGETEVAVVNVARGQELMRSILGLGKIVGLAFAPDGSLYVADDKARQVASYRVLGLDVLRESSFGRRAQPGDDAPQRFYELIDVAAGPDGSVVTVERLPVGGSRISRWPAHFIPPQPFWTHLGLEFTGNAAYAAEDPDTLVSTYFQRYRLDRPTGGWQFRGNLFCGGNTGPCQWHGAPRWVTLGGERFFYFANGDGMQAYRLEGSSSTTKLGFVMAIGGREPGPDGTTERAHPPGQWTWTQQLPSPSGRGAGGEGNFLSPDQPAVGARRGAGGEGSSRPNAANGAKSNTAHPHPGPLPEGEGDHGRSLPEEGHSGVKPSDIHWFKPPGQGRLSFFGMNVDREGNVFYCDHQTRSIWMIPLERLNAAGNPVYDWSQAREVVAADSGPVKFFPLMAVRTERGEIYAFGRSDLFAPFPGAGAAWMGGWALAKFDAAGHRLWATRLAQHCTGMDYVPGDGGVVLGYFAEAVIYHYNRDGLLVGSARPGKAAGGVSGWLDNTASVACNRDPRDGLIDVFAEEDYAHRILWYRFDDSKITVQKLAIRR